VKFLVDANLPPRLCVWLRSQRHEAEHVFDRNLLTATDTQIWERGRSESLVIFSRDTDFYDRALLYGAPPQVVHIAVGNCTNTRLFSVLASEWDDIEQALVSGCRLISITLEKNGSVCLEGSERFDPSQLKSPKLLTLENPWIQPFVLRRIDRCPDVIRLCAFAVSGFGFQVVLSPATANQKTSKTLLSSHIALGTNRKNRSDVIKWRCCECGCAGFQSGCIVVVTRETRNNSEGFELYALPLLARDMCHRNVGIFPCGLYAGLSVASSEP
jgi:predicted nuclease of predicted toxin-antitoxin system